MARSLDLYADVLDDQGTWKRVLLRISADDGRVAGLRDLDYLGKVESLSGGLVGGLSNSDSGHRKDAALPEWLDRLKFRLKGRHDA